MCGFLFILRIIPILEFDKLMIVIVCGEQLEIKEKYVRPSRNSATNEQAAEAILNLERKIERS